MAIPDYLKGTIVVFDTETAIMHDHVCEIGFSVFKDAELSYEWGTLVKPIITISKESEAVHKISNRDVEDQASFQQLAPWCYNILNSADIHCAYNYEYDRIVLDKEFTRYGFQFPIKPMIDPLVFFKKWNKFNKGKSLSAAAQRYGIDHIGAHRAINDSTATGKVLLKMAATRTDFPKSIRKLLTVQQKLLKSQYEDFAKYRASKGQSPPDVPQYHLYGNLR